jgi:VWFA-related protein
MEEVRKVNVGLKVFALTGFALLGVCGLSRAQQAQPQPNPAQPNQSPVDGGLLIQTETKQVLVDAIVTDKKGNYVTDLKAKDFHVQEDGKDQPIKSFSFEADPANNGAGKTHYLVLMFDNSSMNTGDQSVARQAAAKFIETNAGPDRMMEIVNFGGAVKVEQNFTADAERLKAVVNGIQFAAVSTASGTGNPAAKDFAVRGMLDSLRTLAKGLGSVPGRKILVLFTAGFTLSAEQTSEATATINECNKANVAIYPVDVRGLTTGGFGKASLEAPQMLQPAPAFYQATSQASRGFAFQTVAFTRPLPVPLQARGGGTTTGGTVSGSTGPSSPGRGSTTTGSTTSTTTTTTTSPGGRGSTTTPGGGANNNNNNMPGAGACAGVNATTPSGTALSQGPAGMQSPCASRNLIPNEGSSKLAAQSASHVHARRRHRRFRDPRQQRFAGRVAEDWEGAKPVLSSRVYAAGHQAGELPRPAREGGPRRNGSSSAHRLLQRQAPGCAFRQSG